MSLKSMPVDRCGGVAGSLATPRVVLVKRMDAITGGEKVANMQWVMLGLEGRHSRQRSWKPRIANGARIGIENQ